MNIALEKITLEGMNELDRDFQRDPATFADMSLFFEYRYSPEETRKRLERYGAPDRRHFLIRLDGRPVGETGIKHIDWEKREGELSIHLQNDAVKNRGIGTEAERLLLAYAFDELDLTAVTARVIEKNTRSRRVLEKVGFAFVRQENGFLHYRCHYAIAQLPFYHNENHFFFCRQGNSQEFFRAFHTGAFGMDDGAAGRSGAAVGID